MLSDRLQNFPGSFSNKQLGAGAAFGLCVIHHCFHVLGMRKHKRDIPKRCPRARVSFFRINSKLTKCDIYLVQHLFCFVNLADTGEHGSQPEGTRQECTLGTFKRHVWISQAARMEAPDKAVPLKMCADRGDR